MCIAANTILTIVLVMILGLIIVRFVLAIAFDWFLSWQLGKIEANKSLFAKRKSIVNVLNVNDRLVTAATHPQSFSLFERVNFKHQYKDLYTMCLVTCYSEDEAGLRTTLDSLAMTDYNSEHKMIFIVADGVVKGAGNPKPTGEIILDMIDLDPGFHGPVEWVEDGKGGKVILCANAQPQSYVAIGQGSKRHNMAKTYCGTYTCQNRSVAVILVYKCGTPAEASAAKPGNRGKRDSQILLMDFLSKTMFDEPSSPFQFDLFCKWTHIMTLQNGGRKRVTPDLFEIVLMVDADTKVLPDALTKMVAVMQRDPTVMGLCGETRIMNKNESWVTMIQVFEYYISHHLAKAFESIFGGYALVIYFPCLRVLIAVSLVCRDVFACTETNLPNQSTLIYGIKCGFRKKNVLGCR
jgi:chitin synthase